MGPVVSYISPLSNSMSNMITYVYLSHSAKKFLSGTKAHTLGNANTKDLLLNVHSYLSLHFG